MSLNQVLDALRDQAIGNSKGLQDPEGVPLHRSRYYLTGLQMLTPGSDIAVTDVGQAEVIARGLKLMAEGAEKCYYWR